MKIGLYFGSFNPLHNGHLAIANYIAEFTDLDKVWFVVSPQNPFKKQENLLKDYHRLELINIAIKDYNKFKASNIEFKLPKPSYTIDTLIYLKDKYPQHEFSLIMGADNLLTIHKWKNYEQIINNYDIYVVPRYGFDLNNLNNKVFNRIKIADVPIMEISSSFIREAIKNKHDVRFFLPLEVWEYIKEMNFYISKSGS